MTNPEGPKTGAKRGAYLTRPRHVRKALARLVRDMREGRIDATAGAVMRDCYRLILQTFSDEDAQQGKRNVEGDRE